MKKLSYKYKIIILAIAFILLNVCMFTFGYGILETRNRALADTASQRHLELDVLQREQKSFEQGKKDLTALDKKDYPPDELFSKDTKVVKEIQILEDTAHKFGVDLTLSISGTTKTAVRAPDTSGELYTVPYTVTLKGSFTGVMQYIETAEHLPFVTQTNKVTISATEDNQVSAVLAATFYIKK